MLRQELRRKGINAEIIAEVTEEIEEESSAYRAAKRKVKVSTISDYLAFRHKLFSFLKGRGFDYEVCQRTINRMWQESEKERGNA
jgi:SOS response regulatory protein OraA/RecX